MNQTRVAKVKYVMSISVISSDNNRGEWRHDTKELGEDASEFDSDILRNTSMQELVKIYPHLLIISNSNSLFTSIRCTES